MNSFGKNIAWRVILKQYFGDDDICRVFYTENEFKAQSLINQLTFQLMSGLKINVSTHYEFYVDRVWVAPEEYAEKKWEQEWMV